MTHPPTSRLQWPVIALAVALIGGASFGIGRWTAKPSAPVAAPAKGRPALYWYDPMVPQQHFDKPGKSPFMEMQLVPTYAGEPDAPPGVMIDPAKVQNLGVRYAVAHRGDLGQAVTAAGVIDFNQRDVAVVQARTGGFVQRVYARAPGDVISAGAPLADILAPEWGAAQAEFLAVRRTENAPLIAAARQRLALLGMSASVIAEVERTGRPRLTTTLTTPLGGVIRTLSVRSGMTVAAGQTLAEISGLGVVWLNAAVPEAAAGVLRVGQSARVTLAAFPGQTLSGRVATILPEAQGETRTLQVRIELPNPGGRLACPFGVIQFQC